MDTCPGSCIKESCVKCEYLILFKKRKFFLENASFLKNFKFLVRKKLSPVPIRSLFALDLDTHNMKEVKSLENNAFWDSLEFSYWLKTFENLI